MTHKWDDVHSENTRNEENEQEEVFSEVGTIFIQKWKVTGTKVELRLTGTKSLKCLEMFIKICFRGVQGCLYGNSQTHELARENY